MNDTRADQLANELTDRLCEHLDTVAPIVGALYSDDYDGYDPWGSTISHAFALNDIAFLIGVDTDASYSPGLGIQSFELTDLLVDDEGMGGGGWPESEYAEMVLAGRLTGEQVGKAIEVLMVALHGLEMLGLNY